VSGPVGRGRQEGVDDRELLDYFADLARRLMAEQSVDATMRLIVAAAVELIDGCDHASLSHMRGKSLVSASSNDTVGILLDGIQTGAQEGPCLEAIRTGEVVASGDLTQEERWPAYGPRAAEAAGVVSSIAFPLHDGRRTVGALNLFSETVDAFGERTHDHEVEAVASVLTAHATPALAAALFREDMKAALESRDVIGQAKGMLMARTGVDEEGAFDLLRRASQRMQVKLAEVARRLVSGELVEDPGPDA
jgi:transcriptional regulator with GAF, ATPase, and Fis domain